VVCLAQTPDRIRGVRQPQNPANDAHDLGAILAQLGFTATVEYDLNEDNLDRAVADFAGQACRSTAKISSCPSTGCETAARARSFSSSLILDAGRDNPCQTSRSFGGSRGLAGMLAGFANPASASTRSSPACGTATRPSPETARPRRLETKTRRPT
jgi:hypothetical protein